MNNVTIGRGAVVRRAILDKNVVIPDGAHIGVESDMDRQRYQVSPARDRRPREGQRALP